MRRCVVWYKTADVSEGHIAPSSGWRRKLRKKPAQLCFLPVSCIDSAHEVCLSETSVGLHILHKTALFIQSRNQYKIEVTQGRAQLYDFSSGDK
jgi:hypothetical protein